jgi:ABC-type nitrate/sulfonate/bicarbonate transport system permease component
MGWLLPDPSLLRAVRLNWPSRRHQPPSAVSSRLWKWLLEGSLWNHLSITLYATALGFIIGSVNGGAISGQRGGVKVGRLC